MKNIRIYKDTEVLDLMNQGHINLRDSLKLATSPKKYALLFQDNIHFTNNPFQRLDSLLTEYPETKVNQVGLIDLEEYRKGLTALNFYN